MTIKQQIEQALALPISTSNVDFCDFQCNSAFQMAKQQKRKPLDIATEIAEAFNNGKGAKTAKATAVAPGFVNFVVTDNTLETTASEILKTSKLPLAMQKPRTIFFDYGGANVAKELHIGHLRPHIIGESIKRVFKALGHKTVSDTYFGDWGLQMGLVLAQLFDEGFIVNDKFVKEISMDIFNVLYPRASKRSKEEPDFRVRAEQITVDLQNKKQPYYDLWKTIRDVSVTKIKEIHALLNCTFDILNGESDAHPYVDEVLSILSANGAHQSDGCLIMDIKKDSDTEPMPPIILQKSNGGDLYATSDIATIYYRYQKYKPDEFVYVTDFRQELHFKQIFRTALKGKLVPPDTKLTHISHGSMNGTDGKPFKTRAGGTARLVEIIDLITQKAYEKSSSETAKKEAQKIGIAGLKFADLSNNVRKDYIFDVDKFTSFEGKTGPYLLYTVARINSILKKATVKSTTIKINNETRKMIMSIIKLADSYTLATQNYTLNGIIDATYELAAEFNIFYANVKIADNSENLAICELVRTSLLFALDTLAIEPVSEM